MYKLACEQTLLLREVTRERQARSLAAWLASLATQCVGIACIVTNETAGIKLNIIIPIALI